ncbi:hypothetical protein [Brumimicrobium mesophilum]|uniref:hypothetical protein n=1 Tax=Brumimicrobium mesophilum TaxID=392717 RepID=UPI00131AEDE2|nr:hypothetical protein [Brumimicrobium mesophilum]
MKILLSLLAFLTLNYAQGQIDNFGTIRFGFERNGELLKIKDTVFVKYYDQESDELHLDTAYTDSKSFTPSEILPVGVYKIEIITSNIPTITVTDVIVESERISFVPRFIIDDLLKFKTPIIIEYTKPKGFNCG